MGQLKQYKRLAATFPRFACNKKSVTATQEVQEKSSQLFLFAKLHLRDAIM